jgi:hypothetical protein
MGRRWGLTRLRLTAPVREGAVYGLAKLLPEQPHLRRLIEAHTDSRETSPGVRRAAWSILD